MNEIKKKIEKLLNLSMSDNEHEAKLALDRALKLMNEHNITKDEVYKQQMINKEIELPYKKIPDWVSKLYGHMAYVSGCYFVWVNGRTANAKGRIVGRERDVENSEYLVSFLYREVVKRSEEYKKNSTHKGAYLAKAVKSFKVGMIEQIAQRIYKQKNQFFTEVKSKDLVCMDLKTRVDEAMEYLKSTTQRKVVMAKKKSYEQEAKRQGAAEADKIDINIAVSKQKNIKLTSA
jgi:hypothetical protein